MELIKLKRISFESEMRIIAYTNLLAAYTAFYRDFVFLQILIFSNQFLFFDVENLQTKI